MSPTVYDVINDPQTSSTVRNAMYRFLVESLNGEMQRIVQHYDARSDLYTSDADLAAGLADIARAALCEKPATQATEENDLFEEFKALIKDFLTDRLRGETREDLLSGKPWENKDEGKHYFRLKDLTKFLEREGLRGNKQMSRGQVTQRIRDMGGDNRNPQGLQTTRGFVNTFWLPSSAINKSTQQP